MEKNQVLLAVEEYNELRDFKREAEKALEDGKFVTISHSWGLGTFGGGSSRKYYTESQIVSDFAEQNEALEADNKRLVSKLGKVAKMSAWEFRKWRKSQAK